MTIRQLKDPCWVLDPCPWDDDRGIPHYATRGEAETALEGEREEASGEGRLANLAAVSPRELPGLCWVAECDAADGPEGCCGNTLGDEEEGPSCIHFGTVEELLEWMPGEGWVRVGAAGALCGSDAELGGWPILPPRVPPAEQEAAGQLVIPGAVP